MRALSLAVGALVALLALPAVAQMAASTLVNVRGKVEKVEGNTLTVKSRDGKTVAVTMGDKFGVLGVKKISLSDIKENDFVGIAAAPGKDGKLHAQEVLLFPEAARGTGEGHYAWDLKGKNDSMTNATVAQVEKVTKGDTTTLKLKHKDGENDIVVGPKTPVVTFAPDELSLLKPGAAVFIRASKKPDGTLTAQRAIVEKNGVKPPM
ncbi:MAG TPA: hypothetical protein VJO12_06565 [Stellaceae bacterium]|nr:hypothetical protein [Stellaceae bacterium]